MAIASVLAMGQPILLLDEPTSQLDPVAAEELLALVVRINRDRGITVVIAEHRTGRLFAEADRVVVMDAGRIVIDAHAGGGGRAARRLGALAPAAGRPGVRARRGAPELPLTVRAARAAARIDVAPPARRRHRRPRPRRHRA